MPHVNADIHEQGVNSPYYFAPAARPYHDYITDWQADFQDEIGKNHMKYFDENGWLYFTKEVFDLLYPSYADTYSTFNGAIGMTYEQGGSGRAGRAIEMSNEDTLTLLDRVMHHHTTALSTVEVSSKNAAQLVEAFAKYFKDHNANPPGKYRSYVIKGNSSTSKLKALVDLLDKNDIQYGTATSSKNIKGFHYQSGAEANYKVEEGDLVISAHQPLSILVQVLFEPQTSLEDSLTYDITAWSLPYAYGVEAYASTEKIASNNTFAFDDVNNDFGAMRSPYAYVVRWEAVAAAEFLGALFKEKIKVRTASRPFAIAGQSFDQGTLIITQADNRKMGQAFHNTVQSISNSMDQEVIPVATGNVSRGFDFGSGKVDLLDQPNILVLTEEGTFSQSYGQIWYYFEQVLNYPITRARAGNLGRMNLDEFNVIILPEGSYYNVSKEDFEGVASWVRDGGKLITLGSSVSTIVSKMDFKLERNQAEEEKENGKEEEPEEDPIYSNQERDYISRSIPGAIYKVKVDNTHPLAYGFPNHYFSIKTGTTAYKKPDSGWTVGYIEDEPFYVGFVGSKVKKNIANSTIFGVNRMGRGSVVYMVDNPLFRAFWYEGMFLFSNAVFMVD